MVRTDGGGVRGLAELLILERIFGTMEAIVANELGDAARPLLPSDFFDLIGGTSTGGWVLPVAQHHRCLVR